MRSSGRFDDPGRIMPYQLPVTIQANGVTKAVGRPAGPSDRDERERAPANPVLPFDRPGWSRREPTPYPAVRAFTFYPNNRLCGLGEVAERCVPEDQ